MRLRANSMRLNLGCGTATFPTTIDNAKTAHLKSHMPDSAYTERWVNVDKTQAPGVDETIDLFSYPWMRSSNGNPWNDNSADEIWASHIIEHIPHEAKLSVAAPVSKELRHAASIDGWFAWFYEAWRILKPGALLHLVMPWWLSTGAVADPTHRRQVNLGSFVYFYERNEDASFDYGIVSRFELAEDPFLRMPDVRLFGDNLEADEIVGYSARVADGIDELYITLEAIKE